MPFKPFRALVPVIIISVIAGCSRRRDEPLAPDIHPDSWMDPTSPDFHGLRVTAVGTEFCNTCHGEDARGGVRAVSCYNCHDTEGECVSCHGGLDNGTGAPPPDLEGNTSISATGVGAHTIHISGEGGFPGIACLSCHLVPVTMADPGHQDTPLPAEVAFDSSVTSDPRQASWDPSAGTCKGVVCHGAANTTPKWTESHQFSCTDCHGGLDNGTGAPPPDLEGNTSISATGVGAHQSHVMTGPLRVGIDCVQCHITPSNVDDPGHIEGGPPFLAEITWGDLASLNTSPVYIQGENPRCSNVYCHGGSFDEDQKGTLTEPTWTTVDGTQAACGTCHKIPPHQPYGSCELCHGSVVSADTTITESGKSLHINGVVDF